MKIPDAEHQTVVRPIVSLISKCEKALQKLTPETCQHTMLQENLRALRLAVALINDDDDATARFTREELQQALDALASMTNRTEMSQHKFSIGTSQHTLQRNRLDALCFAQTQIKAELDTR